jgi:hypothetical protein
LLKGANMPNSKYKIINSFSIVTLRYRNRESGNSIELSDEIEAPSPHGSTDIFIIGVPNIFVDDNLGNNQRSLIEKTLIEVTEQKTKVYFAEIKK